jgi:hypothetical protein
MIQNSGQIAPIKSGETIRIKEGEITIRVLSNFLEINTAENTVTRTVVAQLPLKDRIRNFIQKYWVIFLPLAALLAALLLYWLMYRVLKKRFPKYMASKPEIKVETDENSMTKWGSFKITPKSKWLPLCPEKGTIVAAADGKLPRLKVRAIGNDWMELTNTSDFAAEKLSGVDFFINDQPLPEGSARNKEMSCTAQIKSIFYSTGIVTTHTCSFVKRGTRRRK